MQRSVILPLAAFLLILLSCNQLYAGPKYLFKIASLAPAGSVWVEQFDKFAKEIREKTTACTRLNYPFWISPSYNLLYRHWSL